MKRFALILFITFIFCVFTHQLPAETPAGNFYLIGPNDVLEIKVLDHDELRTMATVSSDGSITFPYIGTVAVEGKSPSEIEKIITDKLTEGYIKYPVVTVSLLSSKSKKIFAYGELYNRGEIPLREEVTLLQALSMAGGVTDKGRYGKLKVMRKKDGGGSYKTVIESAVNNGVLADKKVENRLLQSNDMLIVEQNRTFLIQGDVSQRGQMVYEKDMTVLKALLQAGGVTENGLYGKIKVRRKKAGEFSGYEDLAESKLDQGIIEDKNVEKILLQPDDIVIVERGKTILIQGEVTQRGRMLLERDMTVLGALLQAGGVTKDGLYGKIKIRRKQGESSEEYRDNIESKINDGIIEDKKVENLLLEPDDILLVERNNTFLIQGEVVQRGRIVLENEMTVLRALLQVGGVTTEGLYGKIKLRRKLKDGSDEYRDIVESKLNDGAIENREVEETLIEPDDILVIEPNKTFFIYGEVMKPGVYVLKNNMTVFQAITVAGGFSKWGSESKVKILRYADNSKSEFETIKINVGDIIGGDAKDMDLKEGDVVVISSGIF